MSQLVYTASCNPPRRAKRPRSIDATSPSQETPAASQPRPILPKRAPSSVSSSGPGSVTPQLEPEPARSPNKRGRKPGPLSRSAREAQRRLNHSIIEKARRTKINNALATLKELVPLDYGRKTKAQDNSDGEEDGDEYEEDEEYGIEKAKTKPKSGKKEEKEREYKLEILVRTVTFMQDLLHRVAVLEQADILCSNCGGNLHSHQTQSKAPPEQCDSASDPELSHPSKRARTERYDRKPLELSQGTSLPAVPQESSDNLSTRNRLPSISSWLPDTLLDQSMFSPSHTRNNRDSVPPLQLLTPPASTQFQPTLTPAGFTSSSTNSTRHQKASSPLLTRTPEDEHAATMLLQISSSGGSSSPTFRPLPPSIMSPTEPPHHMLSTLPSSSSSSSSSSTSSLSASNGNKMPWGEADGRPDSVSIAVQTPSTLLGLITIPTN